MVLTVLYPSSTLSRFDEVYYTSRHIPLLMDVWAQHLVRVDLCRGAVGPDGREPIFRMIASIYFHSATACEAAFADPRAKEIAADVATFTDCSPQTLFGHSVSAVRA